MFALVTDRDRSTRSTPLTTVSDHRRAALCAPAKIDYDRPVFGEADSPGESWPVGTSRPQARSSDRAVPTALSSRGRGGACPRRRRRRHSRVTSAHPAHSSATDRRRGIGGRPRSTACSSGVALNVVAAEAIAPGHLRCRHELGRHPPGHRRGLPDGHRPHRRARRPKRRRWPSPTRTLPDVWIPDSSLWVQRLRTDIDGQDTDAQSLWIYPVDRQLAARPGDDRGQPGRARADGEVGLGGGADRAQRLDRRPDVVDRRPAHRADRPVAAVDGARVRRGPAGVGLDADARRAASTSTRWSRWPTRPSPTRTRRSSRSSSIRAGSWPSRRPSRR